MNPEYEYRFWNNESIRQYLKKNHKIDSHLIGASVPELFKVPGTPEICHCAVLIVL